MDSIGKLFLIIGSGLVIIGLLFWAGSKLGLPLGRLPGDIHVKNERYSFSFPIVTMLAISLFFTFLLNLISWFWRK